MIIIPAIDIINSKAVRLYKGDYNKEEVISSDVISIAKQFEKDGAKYIHVVDLDGAKIGSISNLATIKDIVNSVSVDIEVGGGIRDIQSIECFLKMGVSRVILGTSAIKDKEFLKDAILKYGEKIAVGVDFKDDKVCTNGWLEKSEVNYLDFCKELEQIGVKNIIVTDISKDGTLKGVNFEALLELSKILDINITASGGISCLEDIEKLNKMNIYAAITGKAIYSNKLNLKEAVRATNNKG